MSGYTHSDAFDSGTLAVGTIHHLHYEQYGEPDGKPGTQNPQTYGHVPMCENIYLISFQYCSSMVDQEAKPPKQTQPTLTPQSTESFYSINAVQANQPRKPNSGKIQHLTW